MVEQEEGVEGVGAAGAEGALEPDACPFDYHLGLDKLLNWTGGCHDWVSFFGSRSLVLAFRRFLIIKTEFDQIERFLLNIFNYVNQKIEFGQ
jgi:hypothetical protein